MAKRKPKQLITDMQWFAPDELHRYPDNPRVGDRKELAKVIRKNGYAKVLIVQKSTMCVLDGNQTHQCATELGIDSFPCVLVDVDDTTAAKMVLAANRLSDRGGYDPEATKKVMDLAGEALGTGFSTTDFTLMDELITDQAMDMDILHDILRPEVSVVPSALPGEYEVDVAKPKRPKAKDDDEVEDPGILEDAPDDLIGSVTLKTKEHYTFPWGGEWGFPVLDPDMLATPDMIDPDLKAWAGSATKGYENDDQWWMYNVGIDSTSGIRDMTKTIVSFYAYDNYFDKWWDYPERWVSKMINSGVELAVTPDWSQVGMAPRAISLWNWYRNMWMGRYFQDAGIMVIPNVSWIYNDRVWFDTTIRPSLPDKLPVIAIQLQSQERDATEEEVETTKQLYRHVIESCNAELTIVYSGFKGMDMIQELVDAGMTQKLQVIEARRIALDAQARERKKKTGL